MAKKTVKSKMMGLLIGAVLIAAAVISVFFIRWDTSVEYPPPPIRPLKTMVIGAELTTLGRQYPGRVKATQEVQLAFNVSGPLIELLVKKGELVEKDQLLARIDPRDYQNALDAEKAKLAKTASDLEKIKQLTEVQAASPRELVDAKAKYDIAQAQVEIAQKALNDTYMHAPFAGVVANRFVENFENVLAKQAIFSIQDISEIEILVNVPEERMILAKQSRDHIRFVATFEYLPGRKFDVDVKEFAAEADPATQTFLVTFVMPAFEDAILLPGMTATITEYWKEGIEVSENQTGYTIPLDVVAIDGQGIYYVWKTKSNDDDTLTVHRSDIKVGPLTENEVLVVEGIQKGDRIATAGVHLLEEGQIVRLFEERQGTRKQ